MAGIIEAKNKVVNYLKDIKAEAKKVVWPKKSYVIAATIIILVVIIIIGFLILFIDFGLARIFERLLNIQTR